LKIHLDTDIGGDIDDLCALAMLLRWTGDIDVTGITTVAEANGRRAGYARYVLGLEGRDDIPVAAGADVSEGFYRYAELAYPPEQRYWPQKITLRPGASDRAVELLRQGIEKGATIVAIGPYTNLRLLDAKYPGILKEANLFLMGGFVYPIRSGFPDWGNELDWNIQVDVQSAKHVIENSDPTLVPLTVSVETALRRAYLEDLKKAGNLGRLLARQADEFALDQRNEDRFGACCSRLPADTINFQHDPLACAIAAGWSEGVVIRDIPLRLSIRDGWLHEEIDDTGKQTKVVVEVDGERFSEFWFETVSKPRYSARKARKSES